MGMRVLHVHADLIEHLLSHGTRCARPVSVPLDLEVMDVRFDAVGRKLDLVVRSGEWEELPLRAAPVGSRPTWIGDRLEPIEFRFASLP